MNEGSKTVLKGLLLVLSLALSKELLIDPKEIDEAILTGAMTALTLLFTTDRFNDGALDNSVVNYKIQEKNTGVPVITKNTLNKIQSTLPQLTHHETEILSLMSKGLMNNQIAMRLGISDLAVKSYLKSVLCKLNSSLTSSPAVKAVKNSLVNVMHNLHPIYHKGSNCCYKPILCQEGWCSECLIFRENTIGSGTSIRS
jgi:DNA-binding NarL/FixJ family response regulator